MKRIRLTFSRNKSAETKSYKIFRSTKPNVDRGAQMIMEVEHFALPKPIKIENETLTRVEPNVYQCLHPNIMPDEINYPSEVFLNGVSLKNLGVEASVSYDEGMFYFSTAFSDTDVLTAVYYVDAIQVYDTDEFKQDGVTYHGPTARDRSTVTQASNFALTPEVDRNRIVLNWQEANTAGMDYHYRVEAVDVYGNFSVLSDEAQVLLHEGLFKSSGYLVERSLDKGASWHIVSKQSGTDYVEYMPTKNPPGHVENLNHAVQFRDVSPTQKVADIHLNWSGIHSGMPFESGQYRVGAYSTFGALGPMSNPIGPVYFYPQAKKIVVRAKQNIDGTLPTFDGNDAITIAELPITDLTFTYPDLNVNTEYSIALYVVDDGNQASPAMGTIVPTTVTP